jgi:lipopolysaccharide/colanic/teichoic acid biosynthesis glycosyltransferase
MSRLEEIVKRGFDIAVAITGLFLLSPILLLATLAIKLESRGPALCRRPRYSLNGATIEVFRLGSMSPGRIGRVLRHVGIDKIPQLINVLRGDMSIVGPCLYRTAPAKPLHTKRRCNAKPGMINWPQVGSYWDKTGGAAKLLQHQIEHDLYYIEHRSFLFDIKIILYVLFSTSSYR